MKKNNTKVVTKNNSTDVDMINGVFGSATYGTLSPLSNSYQLGGSNQYNPLSLNRILLSYCYMTHGVLQTAIDQPVEDAFRGGLEFKSEELDADDLKLLADYFEKNKVYKEVKDVMRWAKLYGGAALIINTDQDPKTELDMDLIDDQSPITFFAADRWEILFNYILADKVECPYNYYGQPIHRTRVIRVLGKEAPSFIRKRLQGWGMSEIERMIRDINGYVKNQDVIYELLDEAKIDIWKIQNFNSQSLSSAAQGKLSARMQIASMMKNYHNAIVMDKEDDYDQKQLTFAGLAEMLNQIRIGAAASVRMPMTKLFGLSATGFASGEDDIENYNALVESEVRAKAKEIISQILPLICRQVFGYEPEDLTFEFKTLRVLTAEQEENVKTIKFNRISALYSQGMLTGKEYAEALKAEHIFKMDTEVSKGLREPEPPGSSLDFDVPQKGVKEKVKELGRNAKKLLGVK